MFPDGELEGPGYLVSRMNDAGFEIRHEENLREHYALTLAGWCANLDAHWDEAVAEVGAGTARVWRLYMAGSRLGFERNVVAAAPDPRRQARGGGPLGDAAAPRLGAVGSAGGRLALVSAKGAGSGGRIRVSPGVRGWPTGHNGGVDSSRDGPRSVVLLGSTGSIGTQAADVIRRNPDRFRIAGLAAGGGNPGLLASQALEFGAEVVAVEREQAAAAVSEALRAQGARTHPKVLAGPDGGGRGRRLAL